MSLNPISSQSLPVLFIYLFICQSTPHLSPSASREHNRDRQIRATGRQRRETFPPAGARAKRLKCVARPLLLLLLLSAPSAGPLRAARGVQAAVERERRAQVPACGGQWREGLPPPFARVVALGL